MTTLQDWQGIVGRKWAASTAATDRMLDGLWRGPLAGLGIRPGWKVIDLGCGAGSTTVEIAGLVGPQGHVTGVDVSPDMTALAEARVKGLPATILCEDAATHAFPEHAADALFSRFGSMFFDDPPAAFANLHRGLKLGAPVCLLAWGPVADNPWATIPKREAEALVGPGEPSGPTGPFAWADPEPAMAVLRGAGFEEVAATPVSTEVPIESGDDPDPVARGVHMAMTLGPGSALLKNASDAVLSEMRQRMMAIYADYLRDGAVYLPARIWVVTARG